MASLDRPKLRPLTARSGIHEGQAYAVLEDPLRIFNDPILIPLDGFQWVVRHFDGQLSLREIQARVLRETGQLIELAQLQTLVEQLDRALVLDGPTFAAFHDNYRQERTRPAALAGRSYAATGEALRTQL